MFSECRLRPVVLEASYTPSGEPRTPLQQAAIDAGCEVIDGREMLIKQGLAQWEMWTGQVCSVISVPHSTQTDAYMCASCVV